MTRTYRVLLLVVAAAASIHAATYEVTPPTDWWQTTTLYQIWPNSFQDSDGDGIGDLNGVTSSLEHLVDMGVEVVWLSPFFESPLVDSGYDVSDYRDVNPEYGTLEDLKNLVTRAKELGLRVIFDLVPNQTSDEHEWFVKSKARIKPYTDYYVWNEGILVNGTRQPPNNWLSLFNSGSAWEWVDERQAFYLHQFHLKQPDLNLTNPLVIQEIKDILTFWLDFGLDGFRFDAVQCLVEDPQLRDEPPSGSPGYSPTDFYYLRHTRVLSQPENFPIVQSWRDYMDNYTATVGDNRTRVMFTEAYGNISTIMKYYDVGSHVPFNFLLVTDAEGIGPAIMGTASNVVTIIDNWMSNIPEGATANWVVGNHDRNRVATKYGVERIDGINMMLFLLPGVAVIYNGDEIGMTDTNLTWEQTQDPQACNTDPTRYAQFSRDPVRTPFQWDNSTSAGFSTNSTTMLPVNENYLTLNLAAQKAAGVSHYKNVQALIELRNRPVLREGRLGVRLIGDDVIAFSRELDDEIPIVVLVNWSRENDATFSLEEFNTIPETLRVLIADINSGISVGDEYSKSSITLTPSAAVVLEGISSDQ